MSEINPIGNGLGQPSNSGSGSVNKKDDMKLSLFMRLDTNKDGKISEEELYSAGYRGNDLAAMNEVLFFAERNTNKWFSVDKNKNGSVDSVEDKMWEIHNTDENHKIGDLTPEEFAKKYNFSASVDDKDFNFEKWCEGWIERDNPMNGLKALVKERYGKELNDEETQLLYDVMKTQANRWLFKQDALYNRLNLSAYTRLATDDQTVSCCGGDISKPPIGAQPKLNPDGTLAEADSCSMIFSALENDGDSNSSMQIKNRLAWAAFKTVPDIEAAKMTPDEYQAYQADWNRVRNMKASDYRELLKPENKDALKRFEATSNMTVKQIVDYIDIIESATGKDYDSDDWSVDVYMFHNDIMQKLNGTEGDETILDGKTRADIPPERQELLKYLETHGLLLDRFKE